MNLKVGALVAHRITWTLGLALRARKDPPLNQKRVLRFLEASRASGIGEDRLIAHVYNLKKLSRLLNKEFLAVRSDMEKAMAKIESSSLSDWTKLSFRV